MTSWVEKKRGQPGFTLLELLIVLAIMGLVGGMIAFRGPSRNPRLIFMAVEDQLVTSLREARSTAIARSRPMSVEINVANHVWQRADGKRYQLPPDVAITVETTTGEVREGTIAGIRFEPDGSSTGGRIGLALGTRKAVIAIDWLTGQVVAEDAS